MSSPLPIRVAQTLGISLSSIWGGATLAMSIFFVPGLLEAPAPTALRQWIGIFNLGKKTGPPISIVAAGAYFYLAYKLPSTASAGFYEYVTAGVMSAVIAPYTILLMTATNNKLLAKEQETRGLKKGDDIVEVGLGGESAHALVKYWGQLNFWRGMMLTASGVLGIWTALA